MSTKVFVSVYGGTTNFEELSTRVAEVPYVTLSKESVVYRYSDGVPIQMFWLKSYSKNKAALDFVRNITYDQ